MTAVPSSTSQPRLELAQLLAAEADLTAVDRFSRWHEAASTTTAEEYRTLLPVSTPTADQQYGFAVDLDACSGCKACVTACHALNGLEDEESWRSVGLLVPGATALLRPLPVSAPASSATARARGPQHVTTACHHCLEPACLEGCPVLAYDKDPRTGIVRHLDDQCIGCTYCVMMCPYEVPRFSSRLGIVRKCDLCQGRLAVGEAPACVQACPNQAIRVELVDRHAWRETLRSPARDVHPDRDDQLPAELAPGAEPGALPNPWLPSAPAPTLTFPTTRYHGVAATGDGWRAADEAAIRPAASHLALVLLLVLTQAAAGGFLGALYLDAAPRSALTLTATALGVLGLLASIAHLGQPRRAWRVFLGLRRSWLSREAVVLGAFGTAALMTVFNGIPHGIPLTAALGVLGVGASVQVYAATRRPSWSAARGALRFFGAAMALGASLTLVTSRGTGDGTLVLSLATLAGLAASWIPDLLLLRRATRQPRALHRSKRLLIGPLRRSLKVRALGSGLAIALLLGAPVLAPNGGLARLGSEMLGVSFLALALILERFHFFAASAPDRMPGGIPT